MRMTPRLLAAATAAFVSVAFKSKPSKAALLVHGVPASVISPARNIPSPTWSYPCESLRSTAFMLTV
jgi:hypothetical protein